MTGENPASKCGESKKFLTTFLNTKEVKCIILWQAKIIREGYLYGTMKKY